MQFKKLLNSIALLLYNVVIECKPIHTRMVRLSALIIYFVLLSSLGRAQTPTVLKPFISSFFPLHGTVGQKVIIEGDNFSKEPSSNTVYFGGVKAKVDSASVNRLVVIAPVGAMYQPISVTTDSRTAWSKNAFNLTFPNGSLSTATFVKKYEKIVTWEDAFQEIDHADLDGDGKIDLIIANYNTNTIGIMRNTTTNGVLSFANRVDFKVSITGKHSVTLGLGDFDTDGKIDIAVVNEWSNSVDIFRNLSTVGVISFSASVAYNTGSYPNHISVGDLDDDGKPDMVIANNSSKEATVLRNTSTTGAISFARAQSLPIKSYLNSTAIGDIDKDGKLDVVVTSPAPDSVITIFRNVSVTDTIKFATRIEYDCGRSPGFVTMADVDGDNVQDIIIAKGYYHAGWSGSTFDLISIVRNQSSPGNIILATQTDFKSSFTPFKVVVADVDGDSRPDLITTNNFQSVSVLKNLSTVGTVSFANRFDYPVANSSALKGLVASDLDGDGKVDVATVDDNKDLLFVLQNQNHTEIKLCANTDTVLQSSITGTAFQWQVNTGNGFINLANNNNILGANTAMLRLRSVPLAWNNYRYRCLVNGSFSNTYVLAVNPSAVPSIRIAVSDSTICLGETVSFKATVTNEGSSPLYQWEVNGLTMGNNTSQFISNNLANGSVVRAFLTSSLSCATTKTVSSNIITIASDTANSVSMSITASDSIICAGNPVTFTSSVSNGGTSPHYQWQVNGANVNSNKTFTTSSLKHNDRVRLIVANNVACATTTKDTSRTIVMVVQDSVTPSVSISNSNNNGCSGTLVSFVANPINGGSSPSYQWKVNNKNAGTDSAGFSSSSLQVGDSISVIMTSTLPSCLSSKTAISKAIVITSGTLVQPKVTIRSSINEACPGEVIQFIAETENGGTSPQYQWQVNGLSIGSNNALFSSNSLKNNDRVRVIIISNAACVNNKFDTSNTVSIVIKEITPIAIKMSAVNSACVGSDLTLELSSQNAPLGSKLELWESINSLPFKIVHNTSYSGTAVKIQWSNEIEGNKRYYFSIAPPTGSACYLASHSDTVVLQVTKLTPPLVSINDQTLSITNPEAGARYNWQKLLPSGIWDNIAGNNALTYLVTDSGTYRAQGIKGSCIKLSNSQLISRNRLGLGNRNELGIYYFPNPTTGLLIFDSLQISSTWSTLEILNNDGTKKLMIFDVANKNKISINISHFSPGIYLAVFRTRAGAANTIKIIKL